MDRYIFAALMLGACVARGPTTFDVPARVTDSIRVTVRVPEGEGPFPVFLFVHGGGVPVERYAWILDHVAAVGYLAVAASHDLDLPIFATDNTVIALDAARERYPTNERTLIAGHSLGGVIASSLFDAHPEYAGLALFAAYPAGRLAHQNDRPVLAIAGSTDGLSTPANVEAGLALFSEPKSYTLIPGMNHFAWTDGASSKADGPLEGSLSVLRNDAMAALDQWLLGVP